MNSIINIKSEGLNPNLPEEREQYVLEMEQSLLGAIMACNDAMNHVRPTDLRAEHFYAELHQRIFAAICLHLDQGKVANPLTLSKYFEGKGVEAQYLVKLMGAATSIINVADYSTQIIEYSMRRILEGAARQILNAPASLHPGDLSTVFASAIEEVNQNTTTNQLQTSAQVSLMIADNIRKPKKVTSTGLERFDRALGGGFRSGQSYAVAAPPGGGKTMLAGTISYNLNFNGNKHLFICAEMGVDEVHQRQLARAMRMQDSGFYDEEVPGAFIESLGYHVNKCPANIIYANSPFLTFEKLKQIIANAVAKHKIEGFILDYFQLVKGWKPGHKTEHYEEVAQWIAAICEIYDIWGLITAQLNSEGKARWGDALIMACSNVFYLHRPDKTEPYAWLEMDKCRHTKFMHVGSEKNPSLIINDLGPYFQELPETDANYSYGETSEKLAETQRQASLILEGAGGHGKAQKKK